MSQSFCFHSPLSLLPLGSLFTSSACTKSATRRPPGLFKSSFLPFLHSKDWVWFVLWELILWGWIQIPPFNTIYALFFIVGFLCIRMKSAFQNPARRVLKLFVCSFMNWCLMQLRTVVVEVVLKCINTRCIYVLYIQQCGVQGLPPTLSSLVYPTTTVCAHHFNF